MSFSQFFEKCGLIFFSRTRPLFFFALAVFPILAAALFIFMEKSKLQELEGRFAAAARKEKIAFERKARKERFIHRYSHADPYFLDQKIEAFPLLQAEKERLSSLLHHPAFPDSEVLKERLRFLTDNRLAFAEENIQTSSQMKEIDEKQRRTVEMDESDLQKILSLLEDTPIGPYLPPNDSPQILIKELHLKKHETPLQTQVFEVDMDLLKREFIR
ncbi:MAG TPA: hypothetical protein VLF94_01305 [Chlamydiales bacterium]|nr:hypothetical protein [Chlamydiales bacterium]